MHGACAADVKTEESIIALHAAKDCVERHFPASVLTENEQRFRGTKPGSKFRRMHREHSEIVVVLAVCVNEHDTSEARTWQSLKKVVVQLAQVIRETGEPERSTQQTEKSTTMERSLAVLQQLCHLREPQVLLRLTTGQEQKRRQARVRVLLREEASPAYTSLTDSLLNLKQPGQLHQGQACGAPLPTGKMPPTSFDREEPRQGLGFTPSYGVEARNLALGLENLNNTKDHFVTTLGQARQALESDCSQPASSKQFLTAWMGSQHPSPNVKNPLRIRAANWLEIIASRDAKSTCFQGSQTSCTEIISGVFLPKFGRKKSHHVMDASC